MAGGSHGAVHGYSARSDVDRRNARRQVPRQRVESIERRQHTDARGRHVRQRRNRHGYAQERRPDQHAEQGARSVISPHGIAMPMGLYSAAVVSSFFFFFFLFFDA